MRPIAELFRGTKRVRSEDWLEDIIRRTPVRIPEGAIHVNDPGEEFRQQFTDRQKPSLLDPRAQHAAQCPFCLSRIQELRNEAGLNKTRSQSPSVTRMYFCKDVKP